MINTWKLNNFRSTHTVNNSDHYIEIVKRIFALFSSSDHRILVHVREGAILRYEPSPYTRIHGEQKAITRLCWALNSHSATSWGCIKHGRLVRVIWCFCTFAPMTYDPSNSDRLHPYHPCFLWEAGLGLKFTLYNDLDTIFFGSDIFIPVILDTNFLSRLCLI